MIATPADVRPMVHEFLSVLDEQAGLQESAIARLAAISDAVAARDEEAVRRLAEETDAIAERFASAERACSHVRGRLAEALGLEAAELTVTRLAREWPGPEAQALADCCARLRALALEVRRCHIRTASLVVECARINRALLASLFPDLESARTYGAVVQPGGSRRGGMDPWRPGGGLVDTRS